MPNEMDIARFEQILTDITRLGGDKERTSIVPNLVVVDPAPSGLTDFITIVDERDGDTVLATKVPDVIYAASDKVNVLFIEGAEPIAFQQGSGSPSSGIWGIVPSTSTDIFYNSGDVAIGKSVAPDARLEILDTAQAQLRLTHTEDTKFVDFTLDTNHDLTIKTSSTGQIILQPTTDSTDFFQVLDADGGTPVWNVDTINERIGIGVAAPDIQLDVRGGANPQIRLNETVDTASFLFFEDTSGIQARIAKISSSGNATLDIEPRPLDGISAATFRFFRNTNTTGTTFFQVFLGDGTNASNAVIRGKGGDSYVVANNGEFGVGITAPTGKIHIDQSSTTAAIPVAIFDQADVSEEMFEFISTIGVGNAIEAVGAKTLTVTHFIKVTLPGGLTRSFPVGTIA